MNNMNKKRRLLIVIGCILVAIYAIAWVFAIHDSNLNFYKKFRLHSSAKSYIAEKYPHFKLDVVSVRYDDAGKLYIADCKSGKDTITLNYDGSLDMKYDSRFYKEFTQIAEEYQINAEKRFGQALLSVGIECDLEIRVVLNDTEKEDAVYKDEGFKNEKLEFTVLYNRKSGEDALDEIQFARLSKEIAACIYSELDKDTHISLLKIKYNDGASTIFTLHWNSNMDDMTIKELAGEIRA